MQNMDVCRICLSSSPEKDFCHLNNVDEDEKSYEEILLFCLDIQIMKDSIITRKLCMKCYGQILSFYKFKSLALKNDAYLKFLAYSVLKLDVFANDHEENENTSNPPEECKEIDSLNSDVKEEPEIKEEKEDEVLGYQSDDQLLSFIKMVKYELNENIVETKEKASVKKRGRPKSIKTDIKKTEICEECGKSVRNLKEHALRHIPMKDRKRIKCKECDKTFSTYGSRYKHYRIKHLGIKKHCDICNKDVTDLNTHRLVAHNSEQLRFACAVCTRRFISPSALEAHMLLHTKDKPYECDICHKKFRMQVNLTHHKRSVHEKEKSHLCQYCSKSFFKKYHLQIHLRSHTKEKPYKCPECGKFFSSSTGLNHHKLIHSEYRNYRCQHCDSAFTRPDYLQRHQLSHSKEKTHPCRYCGVKFSRSDHRKRHEFTAHEKHLVTV